MSVDVVTFGCRLNAYELEVIRNAATQAGVENAVVVNTCAVTAEAVRQARQSIRRLERERAGRENRGHRLRGADRAGRPSRTCPRSRSWSAMIERSSAKFWAEQRDALARATFGLDNRGKSAASTTSWR